MPMQHKRFFAVSALSQEWGPSRKELARLFPRLEVIMWPLDLMELPRCLSQLMLGSQRAWERMCFMKEVR